MQRIGRRSWAIATLLTAALFFLALAAGVPSANAQNGASVSIVDFAFQPGSIEVAAGSTVTWTNNGSAPHTVSSDSGAFESGQLSPGASFSQTFDTPGAYTYHCSIHPQMTGTVVVTGGGGGAQAAPAAAPAANQAAAAPAPQLPKTGVGPALFGQNPNIAWIAAAVALLLGTGALLASTRNRGSRTS